jgi:hypothetical protein
MLTWLCLVLLVFKDEFFEGANLQKILANASHVPEGKSIYLNHKMQMLRGGLFAIIAAALLWSCFDEGNCLVSFTDKVIVNFKNGEDGKPATISMDSITVDGISLLNYEAKELTKVELPVNPHSITSSFIFYFPSTADTLVLAYHREAVILTTDCGAANYITGLSIESTDLEDVRIVGTKLLKDVTAHVEIYF